MSKISQTINRLNELYLYVNDRQNFPIFGGCPTIQKSTKKSVVNVYLDEKILYFGGKSTILSNHETIVEQPPHLYVNDREIFPTFGKILKIAIGTLPDQ